MKELNTSELLNKEMWFQPLDEFMVEQGYYSVLGEDDVISDIKHNQSIVYTDTTSNECKVKIDFDIVINNGVDEAEEAFILKITKIKMY
ncbi:Uncharacterised protein [Anaerostipes hadrus]|uniref:Uncharacterized protein n=1 Tax=Anaerostipes hadrus TaxID=649756 RepID=A0A174JFT8_ANAHA|nr:hypothetical protein [Anaerostipes hadrus]CUO98533.1 Uncharacterised protein [Anaerostipes hadrus]